VIFALTTAVMHRMFRTVVGDPAVAGWWAVLASLGTPLLTYATELFSEPLATLGCVIALTLTLSDDPDFVADVRPRNQGLRLVAAGAALGIATAAHVTAVLCAPLLAVYAWRNERMKNGGWFGRSLMPPCLLGVGYFPFLLACGWYNWVRFGDWTETGRGVMPGWWVKEFVAPWTGLYGQLIGPGKGLLWFAPLACGLIGLAILARRRLPWGAKAILAYVALRALFIAGRADWHGGFCLGPRHLVMTLPFMTLVGPMAIRHWPAWARRPEIYWTLGTMAVVQQLYFASGEIFLFTLRMNQLADQIQIGEGPARLWLHWVYTPLTQILTYTRGPWLFRAFDVSGYSGWFVLSALCVSGAYLAYKGRPPAK
jgi:hypothetical protein